MAAGTVDLTGRAALVTGGGSGIGAGIARELALAGAEVVVVGRRKDRLEGVRREIVEAGGRAEVVAHDLGGGDSAGELVEQAAALTGGLDILVHAAGNQVRRPALELALEDFDAVVRLHLRAAFALSQAVGRHLVERRAPGSIVYVASMTSARLGLPDTVAYAAAKSGLLGLTRTLAVEWASHGIRVNAVAVGFVATEMTRDVDDSPARKALVARAPAGRLGRPEEIGRAVAFLASDYASFVTGETLAVDGGWSVA